MTNWAVVVGINHYKYLPESEHLKFAASDAERVKRFLCDQAGFQEDFVILCSDTSKPVSGLDTRPSRPSLRQILREISHRPQAKGADQAWFFFSGHGLQSQNHQNYMLTCDGVPDDLEETALSVDYVIQQLIHCQAKNTVLVLDMCRNQAPSGSKGSSGFNEAQILQQAQQNSIIMIFSCSRGGKSYELPDLKQGAFTHAFLEGLQQHTILKQLDNYLRDRVYALTQTKQPAQIPLIVPEPGWKYDRPLLPHCATKTDVETLKSQAIDAWIIEKNLDLAEQLWELVNDLSTDLQDKKLSRQSIVKIAQERQGFRAEVSQQTGSEKGATAQTITLSPDPARTGLADNPAAPTNLPAPAPTQPEDDLRSEKGIDYHNLRDLLKANEWKAADQETYRLMITIVGKEEGQWFGDEELLNFPYEELLAIDFLWVKYSDGRFGFSVQKQIYVECGAKPDSKYPGDEIWRRFCDHVGWLKNGNWLSYKQLAFEPKRSLIGELPRCVSEYGWVGAWVSLLSHQGLLAVGNDPSHEIGGRLNDRVAAAPKTPKQLAPTEPEDDLSSEKGINYRNLRDLLKAGKWKQADQETADRMCEAMGQRKRYQSLIPITEEELRAFPCADLKTIDALWVKYSNGRFGFSVQKKIWQECDKPIDSKDKNWNKFGDIVGWRSGLWMSCGDTKYDSMAPHGHLPARLMDSQLCEPFLVGSTFRYWGSFLSHKDL